MFMGALLPGLVLVALYMIYILVASYLNPQTGASGSLWREIRPHLPDLRAARPAAAADPDFPGFGLDHHRHRDRQPGRRDRCRRRPGDGRLPLVRGPPGAFYPAILALVSVVAILVVINVFSVNVKEIQDSTDVLGITWPPSPCSFS